MPVLECAFCPHVNPDGAKFCNACGSPLSLRPCTECDAVNEETATACYKCGAALAKSHANAVAAPVTESLVEPALVSPTEIVRAPSAQSDADILALFEASSALETGRSPHHQTAVVSRAQPGWRDQASGVLYPGGRSTTAAWSASKTAVSTRAAALLQASLTGVIVVVLAVSAYYAYHTPVGTGAWLHAPRSGPRATGATGQTQAAIDVASKSAPGADGTPQSSPAGNASGAVSNAEASADTSVQSASPSDTNAGHVTAVSPDASTDRLAMPSEASAGSQAGVAPTDDSTAATSMADSATQPRTPDTGPRQGARRPTSHRPPPGTTVTIVPSHGEPASQDSLRRNPRIAECTEGIAALGFCSRPLSEGR